MKSKEEIEQLAEQYIEDNTGDHYVYCGFVEGYTQCQEDMAKILFNISKLVNESHYTDYSRLTDIKDFINSLNKQD